MRLSLKEVNELVGSQLDALARDLGGLTTEQAKRIKHRMEVLCVKVAEKFKETTGIDIEYVC